MRQVHPCNLQFGFRVDCDRLLWLHRKCLRLVFDVPAVLRGQKPWSALVGTVEVGGVVRRSTPHGVTPQNAIHFEA